MAYRNERLSNSEIVANHYNQMKDAGREERQKSSIVFMRNHNNFIKSLLIHNFVSKLDKDSGLKVLDIGAGKGGDLQKWRKAGIAHYVCADIAEVSLQQCEERYREMKVKNRTPTFTLETIPADCTRTRLKDLYKDPKILFDLVSCQFTFHYCFESLGQARTMLKNIADNLRPGGYFIGTTPDAYDIVKRLQASRSNTFGNKVYSVTFEDPDDLPLFGAKYNFHLEGVVDCPEFLVYFPLLIELAKEQGLKLLFSKKFEEIFKEGIENSENLALLNRMSALQPVYSYDLKKLDEEFQHAHSKLEEIKYEEPPWKKNLGTLSKSEWEALTLYVAFAFVKEDSPKEEDNDEDENSDVSDSSSDDD